jgi:3-hydroxyisobutyrate dehydrogenase
MRLAFLGLGLMGAPMAARLLAAGHDLTVWNRSAAKAEPLRAAGARVAATPAEAAAEAGIVFLNLMDAAATEAVCLGPGGIAEAPAGDRVAAEPRGHRIVVDHSSIPPDRTREIAARLAAANGTRWVDAPVSGGTRGAAEGTLAVMAGGAAEDVERIRPYVMAMARNLTHMGPLGAGQTAKLCNQVISGSLMAVIAEAVRLAQNAGIDAARLPEAFAGGFADSLPLRLFVPRMAAGVHEPPIGSAASMVKDLETVLRLAGQTGTPVPMSGLALQMLRLTMARFGPDAEALLVHELSASPPPPAGEG